MSFLASLLEKFEDDHAFEELCVQLLHREGYTQIEPVGGPNVKGRDAQSRIFTGRSGQRTILFQFTLQGNFRGKIRQTLTRLREAQKTANTVVFAFSKRMSATLRDEVVQQAMDEFGQDIEIKDQRFLVSRLSQAAYRDITQHYFAKDIAELRALWEEDALFQDTVELSEIEQRIMHNLIRYAQHPYSGDFKDELIRQTIRGVLCNHPNPLKLTDLLTDVAAFLPASLSATPSDVNSQLEWLAQQGDVLQVSGKFTLTQAVRTETEFDIAGITVGRRNLYDQVQSHFAGLPSPAPSTNEVRQVVLGFLSSLFLKYGSEIANAILEKDGDEMTTALSADTVASVIASVIPPKWSPVAADAFRTAIDQIFRNPSAEVMGYLDRLSRSYVLMQLVNVDPNALNAQRARMLDSVALLDTDVVLTALLEGASRHATSVRIIGLCSQIGVRCLAGSHELKEIVARIERSIKLYNDLGRPAVIPADKIDLIPDLFLSVYYELLKAGKVRSFDEFIERYYKAGTPYDYIRARIVQDLGIEVVEISAFLLKAQNEKIRRIQDTIESARKAVNRYKHTDLYKSDAVQLVVVEQQNREAMGAGRAGRWFLVSGDGFSFRAYLEHREAFKVKPCVHPVHFLERLRHVPQAQADETTFGFILQSETMLRGAGRDYGPILASLSKIGINALGLPRTRLLELVEDMDRADFTQWLYRIWGDSDGDVLGREEIGTALKKLIAESQSRGDEVETLKVLLKKYRSANPPAQSTPRS